MMGNTKYKGNTKVVSHLIYSAPFISASCNWKTGKLFTIYDGFHPKVRHR